MGTHIQRYSTLEVSDHPCGERIGGLSRRRRGGTPRILLVASGGGHWIELVRLAEAFRDCDCQFVSTFDGIHAPIGNRAVATVADGSRDNAWKLLSTLWHLSRFMRGFAPDIVLSTGAAPGAIALFLGKLMGARTVWIDSIANADALSASGRAVRFVADLRLTQWQHLASRRHRVDYFGQVL